MVLPGKLTQPAVAAAYVDRPRLYRELERWQTVRALLVCAPAGYGKSSLVSRWLALAGGRMQAAWLSLDEGDAEPGEFVRSLAAALDPLVAGALAAVRSILEDAQADPQRALVRLLAVVEAAAARDAPAGGRHLLLVLDDLHLVRSPAVDALLKTILERGPLNLHLFLLSRRIPTLPLARLYANEQIHELGADDLRFTAEEVRRYVARRGFAQISETDLATVLRRSEGWITALQLAMISQRERGNLAELLAGLRGDSRWPTEYLTSEVLAQQPPAMRQFLLQTAILDDFNASLCAAVTGCDNAYHMLAEIAGADLFLIALDSQREWFRYHHLFRELLQSRLYAAEGVAGLKILHRRAAAWLADANRVRDAVRHLRAAGDDEAAVDLVAERIQPEILRDPYRARQWFDLLPRHLLLRHPQLILERCRLASLFGSLQMLAHVEQAAAALEQAGLPEEQAAALQARLLVYRAVASFRQADMAATARYTEQARVGVRYLDSFERGAVAFLQMHLCIHEGRHRDIEHHAGRAMTALAEVGFAAGVIAVRRELARYAFQTGDRGSATRHLQAILAGQSRDQAFVALDLFQVYLVGAEFSYWQNNLAQAQAYHEQAAQLAQHLQDERMLESTAWYGALLAYAQVQRTAAERQLGLPAMLFLEANKRHIHLTVRLLVLARRPDEAWQIAATLGPDLASDPAVFRNHVLIAYLQAYIARGVDLTAATPLLERALAQRAAIGDRYCQLQLLALLAWQQSQLNSRDAALRTLARAASLALATGYVRVILDIPELLPLLGQLDNPALRKLADRPGAPPAEAGIQLTAQEQAVLQLLAADYRYEQVAQELKISINTVRTHIRNAYKKLGASRRAKALERAQMAGLIAAR